VFEEEDEPLVDAALAGDVFTFIKNAIIANAKFHDEVHRFCILPLLVGSVARALDS